MFKVLALSTLNGLFVLVVEVVCFGGPAGCEVMV